MLSKPQHHRATATCRLVGAPLAEELERLRQEKVTLEQALQEEKAKPPVQAPAPDTSDLESRLVGCFSYLTGAFF
jgi:hypothetical protein